MKQEIFKHSDGKEVTYKVSETGTYYHEKTPDKVIDILERSRLYGFRVKLYYGDAVTGKDWNEESYTIGTIDRSNGSIKIPLLILTARSMGGGAVLDNCIVKIKNAQGSVLYQHEKYHSEKIEMIPSDLPEYTSAVTIGGKIYSRHKTERAAKLLIKKLL